jgi:crotonobetainyl-CoA:carnitine CoA-transferase CaiB-like acyl-CoA transferase
VRTRGDGSRFYAPPFALEPDAFEVRREAPRQGEHSREVLREAGCDDAAIDALLASGSVRIASP